MLKKKSKLNYRRGYTWKSCGTCDNFRPNHPLAIGRVDLPPADRCAVIGLQPGRMYQVHRKNICDLHHDSSLKLDGEEMFESESLFPGSAV